VEIQLDDGGRLHRAVGERCVKVRGQDVSRTPRALILAARSHTLLACARARRSVLAHSRNRHLAEYGRAYWLCHAGVAIR